MKFSLLGLAICFISLSASSAQNLIINSDMSNEAKFAKECRSDGGKTGKLSLFSEN
jgi:hypothetical protein